MHTTPRRIPAFALALGLLVAACSSPPKEGQLPPRPEGCEVQLFHGSPSTLTENIGPVSATCAENVTDEDCIRTLKDEACKLGGDVVWGVPDAPTNVMGKKRFTGRAARSKTAAPAPTP